MGNRPLTENMKYVVYAKWKGVEIQIIYDVQGGNALDEPNQTIQYGSNYKLAVPECTDGKKLSTAGTKKRMDRENDIQTNMVIV